MLEIRSKSGWLLDALGRSFDAEVYAMPAFEPHASLITELYGIPADATVDFERFGIPYEGAFDLIIAKHMLTHALFPDRLFATLRERLRPGGWIYLYLENDDMRMYERARNLFGEMKCFHFQNVDSPTLSRCLRRQGFAPRSVRYVSKSSIAALARLGDADGFEPMTESERDARLERYRRWRDESILSLPKGPRRAFYRELSKVRRRALACGDARRQRWRVEPVRQLRLVHAKGYLALNEQRRAQAASG